MYKHHHFLMWEITLRSFDDDDIALAIALGVFHENKGRRGSHGRASRGHEAALDWATAGRPSDSLFSRYVYHSPASLPVL
jgi:hypothetical protein